MNKDQKIETIRGLALLLMVSGHVIGDQNTGMKVDNDSFLRYFYFALSFIRMPLYTVISGYVYSLRPVKKESWQKFYANKSRRLLVPLIFVSTVQYLFQIFIPAVNTPKEISGLVKIYFFPYSHFWYLQALFIVFSIIIIIDYYNIFNKITTWLFGLFISFLLFLYPVTVNFFSIQQVFYLLPFFLLGYGIAKFKDKILSKENIIVVISLVVFLTFFVIQQMTWFYDIKIKNDRISILGLMVGITGTTILLFIKREIKWLANIGKYSFTVYLWHIFGTAGARILVVEILRMENVIIIFILSLILGVLGPIYLEKIIIKNHMLSFLCLGSSLRKKGNAKNVIISELSDVTNKTA